MTAERDRCAAPVWDYDTGSGREAASAAFPFFPFSLFTGTSVILGSILRYPRPSMIQGCSRYGGNSSAAILGSRMGCRISKAALPSFVARSILVITEYAFIRHCP